MPMKVRRGIGSPRAGVIGSFKQPHVSAEN